jgi:pectin methylesterase-like acyl-CoA thioesterase
MGKKSTFSRELTKKSIRGHTDFIFGIESSLFGETLCKTREIIEICLPR